MDPNNQHPPIRFLSVCSGIEAASVAWEPLGWKAVGFSEIEPFPCAVLKHRFPNTPNYGSLTEHHTWPIEPGAIDLLVGGTPCQSFSVAGLRKGLADPRGNLALVFLGLADRLKPRWIVWENVPGVLSSSGGRDFGSFLGALVELGYGFAYRVLDAQHFGVPQRRRRVFVVACLGDWRSAAEVLFEPDCVRRDPSTRRKKGQGPAAGVESGVDANGLQRTVGTLCADTHPGAYSGQDAYTGRLIPSQSPVVHQHPAEPIAFSAKDHGGDATVGISPTLRSQNSVEGNQNSSWSIAVTQPIPYRKSKRAQTDKDDETWVEGEVSNTLNNFDLGDTRTTHAVVSHCSDVAPTDTSSGPPYSRTGNERVEAEALVEQPLAFDTYNQSTSTTNQAIGSSASDVNHYGAVFTPPMAVRRLTPKECERLQGFPDDWTRIPWKGKPEEDCPDGPRYKACGNSMAVPCMAWIGERIARVEAARLSNPTQP